MEARWLEGCVVPGGRYRATSVELSDAFASSDDGEADSPMHLQAGGVLGEDADLDRPAASLFRRRR